LALQFFEKSTTLISNVNVGVVMPETTEHLSDAGTGGSEVNTSVDTRRYPASVGRVLLLVLTAMLVLTQLYAAIPLAEPVGNDLGGHATFALSTVFSLCSATGFMF